MKWQDDHPTPNFTVNRRRCKAAEFAPLTSLNYRAEFVCDAINAEFRRSLGVCAGQPPAPAMASTGLVLPPEGGRAAHTPRITVALFISTCACGSVLMGTGIVGAVLWCRWVMGG